MEILWSCASRHRTLIVRISLLAIANLFKNLIFLSLWPGEGDSNSRRYDPRWFSRPVHSTALPSPDNIKVMEATPGFEPGIRALQARALATWLCRLIVASFIKRLFWWCPGPDLNRHSCNSRGILSPLCLPIPPPGLNWAPSFFTNLLKNGAGNEVRTRDPDLGKVVLYH